MKRAYLLLMVVLLAVLALAAVPGLVGAQSASTPLNLSPEAWQRFLEERRAGDVPPLPDRVKAATSGRVEPLAFSDQWAWVVYQSYRDDNWEIYLRHDGQEFRVTNNAASDTRPRLNRGATRIAFNSNRSGNYEIYTMKTDGSDVQRLTNNPASDLMPYWSPDGTQLAFASNRTGEYEIYLINADGSNLRQFTSAGLPAVSPAWSPVGSQIAWIQEGSSYNTLFVKNLDGTDYHALLGATYLADLTWSPNGTRLAYDEVSNPYYYPFSDIYVANATGGGYPSFGIGAATFWVDVWAGGWTPDSVNILFSQVHYTVINNKVYIAASYVNYQQPGLGYYNPTPVGGSSFDMLPDCQTNDLQLPTSRVLDLPAYSRASGFNVAWGGTDVGAAGIAGYEVQVKVDNGAWTDWQYGTPNTNRTYSGQAGQAVAFRSRAYDNALNFETWPALSDTSTLLYTWQITGVLRDIRGYTLPQATALISPTALAALTTDIGGRWQSYLATTGLHTITATSPGYGTLPPEPLTIEADQDLGAFTVPPLDEQLINGRFESVDLTGWQAGGDPASQTTTSQHHTGQRSATLGHPAEFTYEVPDELDLLTPAITVDGDQTTFLVGASGTVTSGHSLTLMSKPIAGPWSSASTIVTSAQSFAGVAIAPDRLGGLYVLWYSASPDDTTYADGPLSICHVPTVGEKCDTPEVLFEHASLNGGAARLITDRAGGLHAAWLSASPTYELRYAHRPAGGTWSSAAVLASARWPNLAVDAAQTVYLISTASTSVGPQLMRKSGNTWSAPEALSFGSGAAPQLAVEPNGTQHVLVFNTNDLGLYYGRRTPGGTWEVTQLRGVQEYGATPIHLGVSDAGIVQVIYRGGMWGTWLSYYVRTATGAWQSTPDGWNIESSWVAAQTDERGVIHIIWRWPGDDTITRYTQTTVAHQPIVYSLTQTVTIPAQANRPTLALWYRHEDTWQLGQSRLVLEIDDGTTISQVLNLPAVRFAWTPTWADVSAWTGQTITVNVKLQQAVGSPLAQLYVDDVSLGSWQTPIVQASNPGYVPAWTASTLTLNGQNFVAPVTVHLGAHVITDVEWSDAQTLSLTVPALGPGLYPLWVYNAGGQAGYFLLPVGKPVFLPVLLR